MTPGVPDTPVAPLCPLCAGGLLCRLLAEGHQVLVKLLRLST